MKFVGGAQPCLDQTTGTHYNLTSAFLSTFDCMLLSLTYTTSVVEMFVKKTYDCMSIGITLVCLVIGGQVPLFKSWGGLGPPCPPGSYSPGEVKNA